MRAAAVHRSLGTNLVVEGYGAGPALVRECSFLLGRLLPRGLHHLADNPRAALSHT